jgi:hypothetical protein
MGRRLCEHHGDHHGHVCNPMSTIAFAIGGVVAASVASQLIRKAAFKCVDLWVDHKLRQIKR